MSVLRHFRTAERPFILLTLAFVLAAAGLVTVPPQTAEAVSQISTTYNYTGATQTFTVPAGVTSIEVTLKGGQGGRGGHDSQGTPTPGGYQGVVTGTIAVTPGQVLTVAVGGGGGTGASSTNNAGGGTAGQNPLTGYDGSVGGNAGNAGSSGAGGGSGAATVLMLGSTPIVAGGAGGNGGNGQYEPIVGRRAEPTHTARPDVVSTTGRPGWNTRDACTVSSCDGGGSGAGGGGAIGGERGTIQYGGASATEYFGFGGFPGANSTAGEPGLSASYDYYAGNSANGSLTITYSDGTPSAPLNLAGTSNTDAVALAWNAPSTAGASPITDYRVEHATNINGPFTTFADGVSTTTSTVVTGLTNGITYFFRVTAINAIGAGPSATTPVGIVPSDVPDAPTGTSATPFGGGAYIDFTPGSSDIAITSYEYRLDGGTWQTGSVSGSRLTITGLTNGTAYSVQIRAINAIGPSLASSPAVSVTPIDVPQAPTGTLLTPGNATIDTSWVAPAADNGSAVTDYVIQYATSIGGTYTTVADGTSTGTSHQITGLTNGTAYFVRIGAVNAAGTGPWSTPVSATPFTTPSAPAIAIDPGDGSLTVNITPGFDGGSAVTAWQYKIDNGAWTSTGTLASAFTVFGLTNATSYDVSVRATNAAGLGGASGVTAATPRTVPAAPAISAVALDTGAVSVSFSVGATGGSAITNVQYSIDNGASWLTRSPASTTSPLTVGGLTGGVTYPIQLRVVNAAGPSAASNTSSVTAKGTPSAPTIVVTPADSALVITFTAPSNGGSPITNYEYSINNGTNWITLSPASTTSPITVTGLSNGTSYDVRVRAVNAAGLSPASAAVAGTPRTVPSAPTIEGSTIVGVGGELSAAFTAPTSNGGSAIQTYQYSTDAGATWRTRTDGGTVGSPLVITTESANGTTPLTGGQTYPVELRAVNAAGPGTASTVASGITTTAPAAPVVDGVDSGNAQATIRFTAPANGGSAIIRYEYSFNAGTSWVNTGSLENRFTVTGLTNGTSYSLVLRAVNSVGNGVASSPATAVNVFSTPAAPTLGEIVAGDQTLEVSFVAGDDGGSTILGYEYSTDGGQTWRARSGGTTASPLTIGSRSSNAGTLVNGTVYDVQLRAINAAGAGGASESKLAAPRGNPAVPTGLTVTGADSALVIAYVAGNDGGSPITAVEYRLGVGDWIDAGSLSSPFNIPGLVNGTTYNVSVRTRNAIGTSPSAAASGTARTVPGAPTAVTATGASTQASVSWSAPTDNGGAAITGYTVRLFEQTTGGSSIATCTTTGALECIVTGLTNGVTVYADVVATNEAGSGPASAPRGVAIPLGTPVVQIDSVVSSSTSLSVVVDLVDDGGRPVSNYEYQLDGGTWVSASSGSSPFPIPGLTTGVEYSVRIRATGPGGTSEPSTAMLATPYGLPGAPTGLVANSGAGSATLTWSAPTSDGGASVTDYVVQYATTAGGTYTTFADGASSATGATVTGLTNATTYFFRVAATNAAGTGANSSLASTTPLAAPSAPTITGITSGSSFLQVAFSAPTSNGGSAVTGYQYRLNEGVWRNTAGSSSPTTITGLTNGTAYSVQLRAVNTVGGGTASNAVSATPYGLPGAIVGLRATPGSNNVLLEWDPANANGSAITSYNVIRWNAANEGSIVLPSYSTSSTSHTFTGLGSGTYYFTVEATNAAGTGPRSTPRTTAIVGSTLPSAPTALGVVVDNANANLTWTAGSAGSSSIAGYLVQYSTNGTSWTTMASGSSTPSASFALPSASTAYSLRVAAVSAAGVGTFASITPPIVGASSASGVTATGVELSGNVDANGASATLAFEYATNPSHLGTGSASTVAATPTTATAAEAISASLSGLTPGTAYSVRAKATTANSTVYGAVSSFTTTALTAQTLAFTTTAPDPALVGRTYVPVAESSAELNVTITIDESSSAVCSIDEGTVTFDAAGECQVVASQAGNAGVAAATPVTQTITVTRNTQVVVLSLDDATLTDGPIALSPTVDGRPLTYIAGPSDVCSVTDTSLALIGPGTCEVTATQAGTPEFLPAEATDTFVIARIQQAVTLPSFGGTHGPGQRVTLPADTSEGLPITYTAAPSSVCTIKTGSLVITGTGQCTLTATQAGDATRAPFSASARHGVTVAAAVGLTIDTDSSQPAAGGTVVIRGAGLRPGSIVTIRLGGKSLAPTTATVGSDGTYQVTLGLPAEMAPGSHTLTASATAWDDSPLTTVEQLSVGWSGWFTDTTGGGYEAIDAARILDTRQIPGRIVAGTEYQVAVPTGLIGADATTITVNLTVTAPAAPGFITVYPCGTALPNASTTNFWTGETRANLVDVPFHSGGSICLWSPVDTDAIIDVQGFHSPTDNSRIVPRTATRVDDTRSGDKLGAGETRVVKVVGAGMASSSATVVALNVAAAETDAAGFLTVFPCGSERPVASNLNFTSDQTVSNEVYVKPGTNGNVCIYSSASTHLIVDLNATFEPSNALDSQHRPTLGFESFVARRVADTRPDRKLAAGETREWKVSDGAGAAALNVVATETGAAGFLTVFPCDAQRPDTSNVNYTRAEQAASNHVTVRTDDAGKVCVFTSAATHIVIDVEGIYRTVTG